MLLELAASRRVLFFGGKGGVGKTSLAAAVALHQARAGRRVHLVSTDPAHNLGHLFGTSISDGGASLAPLLTASEINPRATTARHLEAVEATMRRLMPEHLHGEVRAYLRGAREAPGMHEAAILERIAEIAADEDSHYDLVVFDTAPSGHTARLMALPETMGLWTESLLRRGAKAARFSEAANAFDHDDDSLGVGLADTGRARRARLAGRVDRRERDHEIRHLLLARRERFEKLRTVITDAGSTSFVIVLAAERLPVLETIELYEQLVSHRVPVEHLVVNRRSPEGAGGILAQRRAAEGQWLEHLARELPGPAVSQVPLLGEEIAGLAGLEALTELL